MVPLSNSYDATVIVEDSSVVVTTEFSGANGYSPHSVSLSKEQCEQLEQYLMNLQSWLHGIKTKEEAVLLFKEAVVEIDTYGLLPEGMNVEQAQYLVSGGKQNFKVKSKYVDLFPNLRNAFCLLSATATKVPDYIPSPVILPFGVLLLLGLLPAFFVSLLGQQQLANTLVELGLLVWNSNPLRFSNFVMILGYDVEIRSIGLKGVVSENLTNGVVFRGYSGLMLSLSSENTFFLGFAINVISPR